MTTSVPPPNPGLDRPLSGLGIFCIVIGTIIALPSGLCSATLVGLAVYSVVEGESLLSFLQDGLPMLLAAIGPLVIGIVLIWAGFKQRKSPLPH